MVRSFFLCICKARDGIHLPLLSERELLCLEAVVVHGEEPNARTVRAIAKAMGVPRVAITRAADTLVELGCIERAPDSWDKRSITLNALDRGNTLYFQLRGIYNLFSNEVPVQQ